MFSVFKFPVVITLWGLFWVHVAAQANDLLLEDYSEPSNPEVVPGNFEGPYGTGSVQFVDSPPGRGANRAIAFKEYDKVPEPDQNIWGIIHIKNFVDYLDVSSFGELEFSFYSPGNTSTRTISIQLRFGPGTGDNQSQWNLKEAYQRLLSSASGSWQTVTIPLNEAYFFREAGGAFDLTELKGFGILVLNNDSPEPSNPASLPFVYADDVKILQSSPVSPYLNVSPTTIDFGNLDLNTGFRFVSGNVELDYLASATGPWEIRVYTANPADVLGLIRVDEDGNSILDADGVPENNIILKVDPGADSNKDDDLAWFGDGANADPEFLFVLDDTTPDSSNPGEIFYTKVASSLNENPAAADAYPVRFAIDVTGSVSGVYSSEVTFELCIE